MGDSHVGLQARMMSQAMRKLAGTLNRTDTICIFTNQLREKIGVMFGNPETTPGGRALKFYASVRLDIRRIETLKEGVEAIGNRVRVKVAKNKVAPPFKQAEFDIMYGQGISWEGTVLDSGLERKIVQKSGSYFSFEDERLGQGRQNATAFLREHPDVTQTILQRIQAQLGDDQIASARLLPVADEADQDHCGQEEGGGSRGSRGSRCRRRSKSWSRSRSRSRRKRCRLKRRCRPKSVSARRRSTGPSARSRGVTTPPRNCGRNSTGPGSPRTRRPTRVETLARVGYLDDERFARDRAAQLAGRGYGDEWIRADLEAQGVAARRPSPR